MPISTTAAINILNKEFGGTNYSAVATYYVGFRSGGVELTNGDSPGYARIAVTNNVTNFPVTSSSSITNGVAIATPQATGDWLEADEVVLYDAATLGNVRYSGLLDQPFSMLTGQTRSFAAGALVVRLI